MNRITVSLIDELRFLGFGFKELKQFRDTVAEVIRSNGLPLGDGSAVEQILEDIRTDYEPILGFKTKIRDQRKVLTNLTIEIQRQLGIYNALPHVNILLNSLIRKGFGEDEIVRVATRSLGKPSPSYRFFFNIELCSWRREYEPRIFWYAVFIAFHLFYFRFKFSIAATRDTFQLYKG